MGRDRLTSERHRSPDSSSSSSPSSSSSSHGESSDRRKRKIKKERSRSSRHKESRRRKSSRHSRSSKADSRTRENEEERRERRRHKRKSERRRRLSGREYDDDEDDDSDYSRSSSSSGDDPEPRSLKPESIVRLFLRKFPNAADDLKQLLQMVDSGQGVDVGGISDRSLVRILKKLFQSLRLKRNNGVYLLPPKGIPTLDIVGMTLLSHLKSRDNLCSMSEACDSQQPSLSDHIHKKDKADSNDAKLDEAQENHELPTPGRRRLIGPEMPSHELLAAAAELMEAESLLREAHLEIDNDMLIGPPPPAMVAEAASANEAERFEEVARIVGADVDKPYDILGVNWKMSSDNIKKRYWKLSLMVHPDKCSHPQAHQAFVLLNQAFNDLQDPDKRKNIDEKIKLKEEEEKMKVELQALREAAQWRKLQGISIDGDDELLAMPKEAPKRDEWMTTLPPERKPGMSMQSTSFSRTTKEGRGDTSIWTDSPLDKAQQAKQNYLEAYNKAKALGDVEDERKRMSRDAELVDKYNASKRSVSLVQKHREESSRPRKKVKQPEKEEWEGMHPWKPWDREKDLTAGRKKVNFDSENMAQGLASRFSSGNIQRNFL
ncbi:uncharacterized protein LOC135628019 isoform X1 [Musa acuminata AAA Group]|uniref:uncharacterized protein LOC135628019 isoform X1 n=1 Tax=Musa acuminata AAA Group TaxID=214697 RepID=UPI0031D97F21